MSLRVNAKLLAACAAVAVVTPLGVASASPAPAEGTGLYIVMLKDSASAQSATGQTAQSLAERYAGTVDYTYNSLNGFSVRMTKSAAARLAKDPSVASLAADSVGHAADTQTNPPWGLDRVDQAKLPLDQKYTYNGNGSNVTAYIVDSGIRFSHQDFGGRATSGPDYVDNDNNAADCLGHGTHVAGTVASKTYGVAKGAKLVSVRILDCNDSATTANTLKGIDWVTQNAKKPAVANFSLVFNSDGPQIESAIKKSIASGVVWTLSGNNQGKDACQSSPARLPEAITVGNTDNQDKRNYSSNYGSCLDIWAPGTNIVSTSHQNDTGTRTMTGTSMAAPHVAGAAALYLQNNPSASPQSVRDALVNKASTVTIGDARPGSPNKLLYTGN